MKKQLILIIDDEKPIREAISASLEDAGFRTIKARSAEEGDKLFGAEKPDLIVLDLMLPGESGLEFCRRLRTTSNTPIIIVSAKGEEVDKVVGLELGADDYIAKPFGIRELVSRVKAQLRRAKPESGAGEPSSLIIGDIRIDHDNHQVFVKEKPIDLTNAEFQVLVLLAKNQGKNFSRKEILETIWGKDSKKDVRTVDVYIHKLREKLEVNAKRPKYIITAHGLGYRLGEPR